MKWQQRTTAANRRAEHTGDCLSINHSLLPVLVGADWLRLAMRWRCGARTRIVGRLQSLLDTMSLGLSRRPQRHWHAARPRPLSTNTYYSTAQCLVQAGSGSGLRHFQLACCFACFILHSNTAYMGLVT